MKISPICAAAKAATLVALAFASSAAGQGVASDAPRKTRNLRGGDGGSRITMDTAKDLLASAQQLRGSSRRLQACDELGCASLEIAAQASEIQAVRSSLEQKLNPLLDFFGELHDGHNNLKNINTIMPVLKAAMQIASNIPKVGILFKLPSSLLNTIDDPLKKFEEGMGSVLKTAVTPYTELTENTLEKLEIVDSKIMEASKSISSFDTLVEHQCVRAIMSSLVPSFTPAYNTIESVAVDINNSINNLATLLEELHDALNSRIWAQVQGIMQDSVACIDVFYTPFEKLEPLADLLTKTIKIPFPNIKFKHNEGIPDKCPSGHEKWGLNCVKKCASGYEPGATPTHCFSQCPSGYKDVGLSCDNPYHYKRRVRVAKVQWPPWKGTKCDFSSKYGWDKVAGGTACWEKCKPGYRKFDVELVGFCYKSCPNGMTTEPVTKKFCHKKTWNRGTLKPYQCSSGYTFIEGFCLKNCKAGEEDLRYSCATIEHMSIKISDVADKIDEVIEDIKGLPIVSTIEDGIETAVKAVLNPILNALNLPGLDDIVSFPEIDSNLLPLGQVADAFENIPSYDFPLGALDFDSITETLMSDLGIGNVLDFDDCGQDINCLLEKVGAPQLPLPTSFASDITAFFDETKNHTSNLVDATSSLLMEVNDCEETETVRIPIADTMSKYTSGDFSPCDIELDICKKLDVPDDVSQNAGQGIGEALAPLVELVSNMIQENNDAGSQRRLNVDFWNNDDWEVRIPIPIPLSAILPTFRKGPGEASVVNWISYVKSKTSDSNGAQKFNHLGKYVQIDSESTMLFVSTGKKDGQQFVRLWSRVGVQFSFHSVTNNLKRIILSTYQNVNQRVTDSIENSCFTEYALQTGILGPGLNPTVTNMQCSGMDENSNIDNKCTKLCNAIEDFWDVDNWEWEGIPPSSPNYRHAFADFVDMYPDDDARWDSPEFYKKADDLIQYIQQLHHDLEWAHWDMGVGSYVGKEWLPALFKHRFLSRPFISLSLFPGSDFAGGASNHVVDYGFKVEKFFRNSYERKSGSFYADVKANVASLTGEQIPLADRLRWVTIGGQIPIRNGHFYPYNNKENLIISPFTWGVENVLGEWYV